VTGDFTDAVQQSSEILAFGDASSPATTSHIELEAEMADGRTCAVRPTVPPAAGALFGWCWCRRCGTFAADVEAIAQADLITMVRGRCSPASFKSAGARNSEAIVTSPAIKVYICNLMTQANESLGLTAADHIHALHEHAEMRIFDFALINRKSVTNAVRARYALEGATQICGGSRCRSVAGVQPILGDYLVDDDKARHATDQVAMT